MGRVRGIVRQLFPERQLFVRADGRVRYLTLSSSAQVVAGLLVAAAIGWTGAATLGLGVKNAVIAEQQATIAALEGEQGQLDRLLAATRAQYSDAATIIAHQQRDLSSLAEAREVADARSGRLSSELDRLRGNLAQARESNLMLRWRLAATSDALTASHEEHLQAEERGSRLAGRVSRLETRLGEARQRQLTVLQEVGQRAKQNIATLERTLNLTGLPVEKIIGQIHSEAHGVGGPLVAVEPMGGEDQQGDSFERIVGQLEFDLRRWEAMQTLLERAPLARPTMGGYISSSFGRRRDPFTGKRADHKGIDIAAPAGTAVHATAAGVVRVAGWNGAYGRMVEIDHGFGFVTRYGHLRSIAVQKGQRVAFHDKVGTMGSSGRSTGSHVHYEVEFDGEQFDPEQFLKAGHYVFKVEGERG